MPTKRTSILSSLSLVVCLAFAPNSSAAEGWNWTVAPYLWASDTALDVNINDTVSGGGELDFSDLVDKLDAAFLIHFEGQRGKGGFYLDNGKWLAIDPEKNKTAETTLAFPLPSGKYHLTLLGVGENDGEAEHEIFLNDKSILTFTIPLSKEKFETGAN